MSRHPKGIVFYLSKGLEKASKLVDDRMTIWGDSYYWTRVDENLKRYKYLVIHHSVTPDSFTADKIARLHKARGWDGIGYHFVITEDGVIHYAGDLGTVRANVLNRNHECIGILLVGDFRFGNVPTNAQYKAAHNLCKEFIDHHSRFNLSWSSVKFHRELQPTACPGDVDKNKIINGIKAPIVLPTPKPVKVVPVKPIVKPPVVKKPEPTPVITKEEVVEKKEPILVPGCVEKPIDDIENILIKLAKGLAEFIRRILTR